MSENEFIEYVGDLIESIYQMGLTNGDVQTALVKERREALTAARRAGMREGMSEAIWVAKLTISNTRIPSWVGDAIETNVCARLAEIKTKEKESK